MANHYARCVVLLLASTLTRTSAQSLNEFFTWAKDTRIDQDENFAFGLNPPENPTKWVALGDSFAAGPGAGDTVEDGSDCVRGTEAYAYQMQNNDVMPGPAENVKPEFTFKACTGDVTTDLTNRDDPNYQLAAVSDFTSFVTLSIGGNDIKFSKILKKCVFGYPPSGPTCDDYLSLSRNILYGSEFNYNFNKVHTEVLERMRWKSRSRPKTAIFQTGYSQFFDDYTDQCDNVGFFLVAPIGPRITKSLRFKLNMLTHEINYVSQYRIDLINTDNTNDDNNRDVFTTPISYANADAHYDKHRFCRDGVNEPDAANPDTHFFHMLGNPGDSQEQIISQCDNVIYTDTDQLEHYDEAPVNLSAIPVSLLKAFHPTPRGFQHTSDDVLVQLLFPYMMEYVGIYKPNFNIMVLGDYVAYATQDPNDEIYQGFIPHLNAIFRDYRNYRFTVPSLGKKIEPWFIGSRTPIDGNGYSHECYQRDKIEDLRRHYSQSPDRFIQGKVVLLLAGTNDLLLGTTQGDAAAGIKQLIDDILATDRDATILIGQIPLIGFREDADGKTWYPLQRDIVEFNALLAALANEYTAKGAGNVAVVHTSATPVEHRNGDPLLPNAKGYRRIAHDFVAAIVRAGVQGWIKGAQPPTINREEHDFSAEETVSCEFRALLQGSRESMRDSYLQGRTIEQFADEVVCNKTEMCKISANGLHGGDGSPHWLELNATQCYHAGGAKGKPDYNAVNLTLPTVDYDLAQSASCRSAVKDIMDQCIMNNLFSGGWWKGKDGLFIRLGVQPGTLTPTAIQPFESSFWDTNEVLNKLRYTGPEDPVETAPTGTVPPGPSTTGGSDPQDPVNTGVSGLGGTSANVVVTKRSVEVSESAFGREAASPTTLTTTTIHSVTPNRVSPSASSTTL